MKKIEVIKCLFLSFLFIQCGKEKINLKWEELTTPVKDKLHAVYFRDTENGLAIGGNIWYSSIALSTTNGGKNWQNDTLQNWALYGLGVDTEGVVFGIGIGGTIFKNTKTDIALKTFGSPTSHFFRDIAVRRDRAVSVGGHAYRDGKIVTMDKNWRVINIDTFRFELSSVCFSDDTTVHAAGYGAVVRSTDGGQSWRIHPNARGDSFQSVHFCTPSVGYVVGLSGSILKTTDAGQTWQTLRKPDAFNKMAFRSVFFSSQLRGYVCGDDGVLWRTLDGGETWQPALGLPSHDFYDVFVLNETGYLAGENGTVIRFYDF